MARINVFTVVDDCSTQYIISSDCGLCPNTFTTITCSVWSEYCTFEVRTGICNDFLIGTSWTIGLMAQLILDTENVNMSIILFAAITITVIIALLSVIFAMVLIRSKKLKKSKNGLISVSEPPVIDTERNVACEVIQL